MRAPLKSLVLLVTVVVLLAFPQSLFAGMGITIAAGDSFQTAEISLEGFSLGDDQPAGSYSFRMVGKGKPGEVEVRIVNGDGKEVGKTTGRFRGSCPGKPQKTTFAELGYSESSPVKTDKASAVTRVTVECTQGSRIEFTLVDSQ